MGVVYRADIEDHTGAIVAQIKDFLSLTVNIEWNGKGNYQLVASGFDPRLDLFGDDYQVRVWMSDPAEGIPWQDIFVGFHKTYVEGLSSNGARGFSSFGPSLEELLDKEFILWPAGSSQAAKSGVVSTVMREYVEENIGALALAALGRDADGLVSGFSLGVDPASGPNWEGSRSRKHLLSVLQDLHSYSVQQGNTVDFRIVSLPGYQFQFECGMLGADRTTVGLNPATGLNAAGNVPVVFSDQRGNVESYTLTNARYGEANQVICLGEGVEADRTFAVAQDGISITKSPVARRTRIVSVNDENPAALLAAAESVLQASVAAPSFQFIPRKGAQALFRDYFIGDYITGEANGVAYHKRIIGAKINVSPGDRIEDISLRFADA